MFMHTHSNTRAQISAGQRITISDKVGLIFLAILVMAIANVAIVRNMLGDLNGVAEIINVAGKLRMLSQKLAFETVTALDQPAAQTETVAKTRDDFNAAISALSTGGSAFGFEVKPLAVQHAARISAIKADWAGYEKQVKFLLSPAAEAAQIRNGIAEINRHSSRVLAGAEALVRSLTVEAHDRQQFALMQIYALLLLNISVFAVAFIAMRRQIINPLHELSARSRELANGNYRAHIDHHSSDEIGQLAQAFNLAAHRIGKLIVGIDQERQNILQAEMMFRGLAENTVVGVYVAQAGTFRFANPKMAEMFCYAPGELTAAIGILDIVTPQDHWRFKENIQTCLDAGYVEAKCELRACRKDGSQFDIELFASKMALEHSESMIGIILDITKRKQVDRALRVLTACNQALVRASDESSLLADVCRIVQQVSGYPFVWVGFAEDHAGKKIVPAAVVEPDGSALLPILQGLSWDESASGKGTTGTAIRSGKTVVAQDMQHNPVYAAWRGFLEGHAIVAAISLPLKSAGKVLGALTVYAQNGGTFIPDEVRIMEEMADNLAYGIAALRVDRERRHYARQLEHNANHDALTGLANRTRLGDRLQHALSAADRSGHMVAVMLLDLDHFKVINDSMGHAVGDLLLQAVAARLLRSVRKVDTVARLGGDEFVIVMPEVANADKAAAIARKILAHLSASFCIAGKEMHIGVSIGISLYPLDATDEKILLKNVDMAMYRAKQSGRANFHFYTEEMNAHNRERNALQSDLHFALTRGELLLHYQPKVDLRTRRIIGVEALLRWQHPVNGMIFPEKFISLAEETGLIIPIGAWLIKAACRQNLAWQAAGAAPITVAVNLSAWQFHRRDMVGLVDSLLRETGMEAQYLELELTESVIIQEAEEAIPALLGLKALGVQLSLDDFGTGYSSLNYLRRYPFDNLKIDKSFIEGMTSNVQDTTIVKAIIALAHNLNLKVIAEGVETREALDFLQTQECDQIQGYYFCKPLPPEQVLPLLQAGHF